MKWPWKRKKTDVDAARWHSEAAGERLKQAAERWPEVHEIARWSRARRRENHLTELFYKMREE